MKNTYYCKLYLSEIEGKAHIENNLPPYQINRYLFCISEIKDLYSTILTGKEFQALECIEKAIQNSPEKEFKTMDNLINIEVIKYI